MATTVRRVSGNKEMTQDVETREVYRTSDYERFNFDPVNRPVSMRNVKTKIESLTQFGFRRDSPIHVIKNAEGKLVITDGQHRFLAAKQIGMPIYYIFKTDTDTATDIRVAHAYTTSWKMEDYLHHFCSLKYPDYLELKRFVDEYEHIQIAFAINLLQGGKTTTAGGNLRQRYRDGTFTTSREKIGRAHEVMKQITEILDIHERISSLSHVHAFMGSLGIMVTSKHYDHDRFMAAAKEQVRSFVPCGRTIDFLEMLSEIYNFRRRGSNRIEFTQRGSRQITDAKLETDDNSED